MSNTEAPDIVAPEISGLTPAEVEAHVADGLVNSYGGPTTKSVGQIVCEHLFTLFNGVNAVLAGLVAFTGSWRNLSYLVVIFANLFIGVYQEVRSKRTIDKLSILAERPVCVRRGGADAYVAHDDVVLDEVLVLRRGDQVPADAEVIWGEAGLNESLLTGESKPVTKLAGSELMSGSFLDSGLVLARVTRVGADSYASRINAEAKYVKKVKSEIMATLNMIIRAATWLLAPIGLALFLRTLNDGSTVNQSILTTVAALVGMIPQGLVLLTSTVLAISAARLANDHVLVQQFYCIEALARVDVLCLDKTGTITSGSMDFERAVGVDGATSSDVELAAASVVRASAHDANETATAIIRHASEVGIAAPEAARAIGFSSARKYSGCVMPGGRALVMGAAQFVFAAGVPEPISQALANANEHERCLVIAECDGFDDEGAIIGEPRALGILTLSDHIRSNAPNTIRYFVEQGVQLNVISGDDPRTVSSIAAEAGVPDADRWVDASTLTTPEQLKLAAVTYRVFGRVTPQQKRELVQALRAAGHTVAMTGDGVNDVLALREADCSVAMASGSDAARNVAEVVLVDNDFAHMPSVVAEGRRSINNLQRSASLFLVKTVFSAVLAILCAFIPPYPFQPVQMSLISAAIIGIPSFVLALEPNHERVRGSFLGNVLARSVPGSIAVIVAVGLASGLLERFGLNREQISTVCVVLTSLVGFALIVRISLPLNALRSALLVVVVGIVVLGCTVVGPFFDIVPYDLVMTIATLVIGALALVIFNVLFNRGIRLVSEDVGYENFMKSIESLRETNHEQESK